MPKVDERLARIETDIAWMKREITAIRAKLEKIALNPVNTRILSGFAAAIVAWLGAITYIVFFLARK